MADFYPLLDRAIRGLPDNTPEARNALFARARDVLIAQLRGIDPPLAEEDIAHELSALNEVIARIEREQAAQVAAPPPVAASASPQPAAPSPAAQSPAAAPPQATSAPSSAPAPARPAAPPVQPAAAPSPAAAPGPAAVTAGARPAGGAPGQTPSAPSAPAAGVTAKPPPSQLGHTAIRPSGAAPAAAGAAAGAPTPRPAADVTVPARSGADAAGSEAAGKETSLRAPAPAASGNGRRNLIIGGVLAVALLGVAGVAYWANKVNAPTPHVADTSPEAPTDPSSDQKFAQRVDGAAQNQPAAQPGQAVEGVQRAILYEESPDNPQTPRVLQGSVKWRMDSENPGDNKPLENVVRADVSIPEAGLDLLITMRKNNDAALPASHLMELTFRRAAEGEGRVIRDVGVPQFKTEENARGVPLAGLPVAVSESVFLVGLSNLPNDIERNVDLIRNRPWIDLPVRYDNGRRAVIALEKGAEGQRVLNEAFGSWAPAQ